MKNNERLQFLLPSGELEQHVEDFMRDIGFKFEFYGKDLEANVENAPIQLVRVRASDVPRMLNEDDSLAVAGITGSDIAWENGLGRNAGEQLPLESFYPTLSNPQLYIGMTDAYANQVTQEAQREPKTADLSGKMVATKFGNITREVLGEKGASGTVIYIAPGKIEGIQYIKPNCVGIMDVISSGKTARDNGIVIVEPFYTVTNRLLIAEKRVKRQDEQAINDIREKIAVAVQARKSVTTAYL